MKLIFKVLFLFVLSLSTANANILHKLMNLSQNSNSYNNSYSYNQNNTTNGRWVQVSIPDSISDSGLTEKLSQYPSLAINYLNEHPNRVEGVQEKIYDVMEKTNNQSQYIKYEKLAHVLNMNNIPSFKNSTLSNLTGKLTNMLGVSSSKGDNISNSLNSSSATENLNPEKVPGLYN